MPVYCYEQTVPYTQDQMFDLVADVTRYPEFVPGYGAVQVLRREPHRIHVRQRVGLGAFSTTFDSTAELHRPAAIHVRSREPPFNKLDIHWHFEPDSLGCRVRFHAELQVENGLTAALVEGWFQALTMQIGDAFRRRAQALY